MEEFFKWYSNFQNKDPIKEVQIVSSDFNCEEKCKLDLGLKFSILDILIPYDEVEKILTDLGKKYKMQIKIHEE